MPTSGVITKKQKKKGIKQRQQRTLSRKRQSITATKTVPIKLHQTKMLKQSVPSARSNRQRPKRQDVLQTQFMPWQARTEGGCQHIG